MGKPVKINKRTVRQISKLRSKFDFDLEHMTATIPLHFDTVDEIIDIHLSKPNKPVVSRERLEDLLGITREIPDIFSVDFTLTVNDYGDYDSNLLLQAIRDSIESNYYFYDENRKKDNILAVFFLIIGIISLLLEYIGGDLGWFGDPDSINVGIICALLDICAWCFVWEGGAIIFLTYANDATTFRKELNRFTGIRFTNQEGAILSSLTKAELYENWVSVHKFELLIRSGILYVYPLLISLVFLEASQFTYLIPTLSGIECAEYFFTWIMIVIMAVANISFYREKGPLKKAAIPMSVFMSIAMLLGLTTWFSTDWDIHSIFFYMDVLFTVLVIFSTVCLIWMQKQRVDIAKAMEDTEDKPLNKKE